MKPIKIVILDAKTLGGDIDFEQFNRFGEVAVYQTTSELQLAERIRDAEVIIVNKIKLGEDNLKNAPRVKLICVTATGYDNIDTTYCWHREIAVCNVKGYSTGSVAQVTVSMALSLVTHLNAFDRYVKDGRYTESGVQNRLKPYFHELEGMTWGIIGYGNIGKRVAKIASALGAKTLINPHRVKGDMDYSTLDEVCRNSDIISVHVPLTAETRGMLDKEHIAMMKKDAVLINVSRGAVADEAALADAICDGRLGGLGIDVYASEPMTKDSPYNKILQRDNVILTPHMAWGAYEARRRCMDEVEKNIETFFMGGTRNRVDI